jgi:anaerobic ribonucleoside-triphosphate reductase
MQDQFVDLTEFLSETGDSADIEEVCHDCKQPVRVRATKTEEGYTMQALDGGASYGPEIDGKVVPFYKCPDCYAKDHVLRNFMPCEVYTRVVGYYRPVKAFNRGKKAEYKDRVNYAL